MEKDMFLTTLSEYFFLVAASGVDQHKEIDHQFLFYHHLSPVTITHSLKHHQMQGHHQNHHQQLSSASATSSSGNFM
ncbi:hypothetical protein YC2023_120571 [Brassica napus]